MTSHFARSALELAEAMLSWSAAKPRTEATSGDAPITVEPGAQAQEGHGSEGLSIQSLLPRRRCRCTKQHLRIQAIWCTTLLLKTHGAFPQPSSRQLSSKRHSKRYSKRRSQSKSKTLGRQTTQIQWIGLTACKAHRRRQQCRRRCQHHRQPRGQLDGQIQHRRRCSCLSRRRRSQT